MNPQRRRLGAAATGALSTAMAPLARILHCEVLQVAGPKDLPPFGSKGQGYPEGFDISVARLLGMEFKVLAPQELQMPLMPQKEQKEQKEQRPQEPHEPIRPMQSADHIPYQFNDKVDLIVASQSRPAGCDKLFEFSKVSAPLYLDLFGDQAELTPNDGSGRRAGESKGSAEAAKATAQRPGANSARLENSLGPIDACAQRGLEGVPDTALRDSARCLRMLKPSACQIGALRSERRRLAQTARFIEDAGHQAMTANAML